MNTPKKPFPTYKWRWLSVQPSEGLLVAPVFLGVLRALKQNEGKGFSSSSLKESLQLVQDNTPTNITLARDTARNLFRNSGQYWRGTGLLSKKPGKIVLTKLGEQVAAGELTNDQFAAIMIRDTVLPNPHTYHSAETKKWADADLRIKPLELILSIMTILGKQGAKNEAYLTPNELIKIVIPLAGSKSTVKTTVKAVLKHRQGELNISSWPDCAPESNDKRLAREFLLFLENFDVCSTSDGASRYDKKYYFSHGYQQLPDLDSPSFFEATDPSISMVTDVGASEIPLIIERMRIATTVLKRPNQARFRQDVLEFNDRRCVLTDEMTPEVLEAAHIIPVKHGGDDAKENGLCMRVDVHRLFDAGKIRIDPNGNVRRNASIEQSVSYSNLPKQIAISDAVTRQSLEWRFRYL